MRLARLSCEEQLEGQRAPREMRAFTDLKFESSTRRAFTKLQTSQILFLSGTLCLLLEFESAPFQIASAHEAWSSLQHRFPAGLLISTILPFPCQAARAC
jgi:hypothetical protein